MRTIPITLTLSLVFTLIFFPSSVVSAENSFQLENHLKVSKNNEIRLNKPHAIFLDTSLGYLLAVGLTLNPKVGYLYQLNSHWAVGGSLGGFGYLSERSRLLGLNADIFGRYYSSPEHFSWFVDVGARGHFSSATGIGVFLRPGLEYRAESGWNSGAYINLATTLPSALELGFYTGFSF